MKDKKEQKNNNRELTVITYLFVAFFIAMIIYLAYFIYAKSDDFINNPYNKRIDSLSEKVVRGDIKTKDGVLIATTIAGENAEDKDVRSYPEKNRYAFVTGYHDQGKTGLEASYNFELLSSHTFVLDRIVNDIKGQRQTGDTLITTIDSRLQNEAYNALGSNKGAVIAMDPDTGEILAMVSKPDFDPNKVSLEWDKIINDEANSPLLNRATNGLYPPGSTFKIITALEYMRENPTSFDNYEYNCEGYYSSDEYVIHCAGGKAHGNQDLGKSFANSCNSSFVNMGMSLNLVDYKASAEEMLFNKKLPGIKLSPAKSSFVLENGAASPSIMATSIGQGETLVSPYHLCLIASAIANKGVLMKPYLASKLVNDNGVVIEEYKPKKYGRLLQKNEAKTLKKYMKEVVDEGTASVLKNQDYQAYGKTGSAEFSSDKSKTHAWFLGFAKQGKKQIAVVVICEEAGGGGSVAAPVAKKLFDEYFEK